MVGGRKRFAGRRVTRRALVGLLGAPLVLQAGLAFVEPEAYFSPNGGIRHRLLRAMNLTKTTIDLAVFDFTSGELAGALLAAKERGVVIRVAADARQAQGKHSEIPILLRRGVKVRLHRYEGTVNQFLGDGFMALFGAPLAHEDQARRAVLAAVGIQRALRERQAEFGLPDVQSGLTPSRPLRRPAAPPRPLPGRRHP